MPNQLKYLFSLVFAIASCNNKGSSHVKIEGTGTGDNTTKTKTSSKGSNTPTSGFNPDLFKSLFGGAQQTSPTQESLNEDPKKFAYYIVPKFNFSDSASTDSAEAKADNSKTQAKVIDPGLFTSTVMNELKKEVTFTCPGDSLLVGISATYDGLMETYDRQYRFQCRFFQDAQNFPARKSTCSWKKSDGGLNRDQTFTCPDDSFIAGQKSTYSENQKDREFSYQCCTLQNKDGIQLGISFGSVIDLNEMQLAKEPARRCSNSIVAQGYMGYYVDNPQNPYKVVYQNNDVNLPGQLLQYDCTQDGMYTQLKEISEFGTTPLDPNSGRKLVAEALGSTALTTIDTTYDKILRDRKFSFRSCEIGPKTSDPSGTNTSE